MQTAVKRDCVTVDDYIAGEQISEIKHEYIGGTLYGMSGASREHNQIALNIASALRSHLKGKPCRVYMSDIKVRLQLAGEDVFYYPDVMVGCDPRDTNRHYLQYPTLLLEVSSESTERLDRREKRLAYQTIESLQEYIIVAQDRAEVTLFRRANQWTTETYTGIDKSVSIQSISFPMLLGTIYEGL